jgi:hypothetical protein
MGKRHKPEEMFAKLSQVEVMTVRIRRWRRRCARLG